MSRGSSGGCQQEFGFGRVRAAVDVSLPPGWTGFTRGAPVSTVARAGGDACVATFRGRAHHRAGPSGLDAEQRKKDPVKLRRAGKAPLLALFAAAAVIAVPATAMANDNGGDGQTRERAQTSREREHTGTDDQRRNDNFTADLDRIKDNPQADRHSNANGSVQAHLEGDNLTINMTVRGLSPNLPHVVHIHGVLNGNNVCPPASAQKNSPIIVPGIINTAQGLPAYGPILVTLTTSGDASPASALALARAPKSNDDGVISYHRTITLPHAVAQDLNQLHIVMHGRDLNMNHMYDGVTGSLPVPLEAEMPVTCGGLNN